MPLYLIEYTHAPGRFVTARGVWQLRTPEFIQILIQQDLDRGRTHANFPTYSLYEIHMGLPYATTKGFRGAKIWTTVASLRRIRKKAIARSATSEYTVHGSSVSATQTQHGTMLTDYSVRIITEADTSYVVPLDHF